MNRKDMNSKYDAVKKRYGSTTGASKGEKAARTLREAAEVARSA